MSGRLDVQFLSVHHNKYVPCHKLKPPSPKWKMSKSGKSFQPFDMLSISDQLPPNTGPLGSVPVNGTSSSNSNKNLSHVPCKFYRQGLCQAGNLCPFSHNLDGTLAADKLPCKYFQKGNCKFGLRCALAHFLPDGTRVNSRNLRRHAHQTNQSLQLPAAGSGTNTSAPANSAASAATPPSVPDRKRPVSIDISQSVFQPFKDCQGTLDSSNTDNTAVPEFSGLSSILQHSETSDYTRPGSAFSVLFTDTPIQRNATLLSGIRLQPDLELGRPFLRDMQLSLPLTGWAKSVRSLSMSKMDFSLNSDLGGDFGVLHEYDKVDKLDLFRPSDRYELFSTPDLYSPDESLRLRGLSFLLETHALLLPKNMGYVQLSRFHHYPVSKSPQYNWLSELAVDETYDDELLEDCVPASLGNQILTAQERQRRSSRSQLGTLLVQPSIDLLS